MTAQGSRSRPIVAYISGPKSDMRARDVEAASEVDAGRVGRLVERSKKGDRDAFGDLYRASYGAVFRYVRFYLPPASCDDAVAETFIRAWAGLGRYRDTGAPFSSWLVGIARHVVADTHRAAGRTEPRSDPPDVVVEFLDQTTDRLDLATAVARLPKDQRQVVELKFLVGCTNEEVSRAMGRSVGAVNALQWRALGALRRMLEPR